MKVKRTPVKNSNPNPPPEKTTYPWDTADPEIIKVFNLRLPKPLKLKLEFIAARSPHSIHRFIMDEVEAAVERELERLKMG
ncbi:MAG: hypothetical protein WBY88_09865 [Desulfosarcina sp.]